jgi:putative tryptophan/tyrosine transport system substrate-binding protein
LRTDSWPCGGPAGEGTIMRRRDFITLFGGAAIAWPFAVRAQQAATPIVGFVAGRSTEASARPVAAFRKGLNERSYVEGQNVMVEYHLLGDQYDRVPALMADLFRRRVAVIATPFTAGALAAKAATTTTPIVFGVAEDPVKLGLVTSLARPGGNATGIKQPIKYDLVINLKTANGLNLTIPRDLLLVADEVIE